VARLAPGRAERAGSPARAPPRPAVGARAAPLPSGVSEPENQHAAGGWIKEVVRASDTAGPPSDEGGGAAWHQRATDHLVQCVVGDGFHRHVHLRPGARVRLRRAPAGQRRHPFSPSPFSPSPFSPSPHGASLLQGGLQSTPGPPASGRGRGRTIANGRAASVCSVAERCSPWTGAKPEGRGVSD